MPIETNSSGPEGPKFSSVEADAQNLDYHPADPTAWSGAVDPGSVNAALDQLIAASGGAVATKYKTVSRILYIESPAATDVIPMAYLPDAATIIAIRSVTDAGTVTFNIEQRGKFTPATAGTDCMTADQVADTTGEEITAAFNDDTVPADNWLVFVASAVASSPTKVWVSVEYTID